MLARISTVRSRFFVINRALAVCICALAAMTLHGCGGGGAPSAADAEPIVRNAVDAQSKGLAKLVHLTKTNGTADALGAGTYTMQYEAEVEFLQDACYYERFGLNGISNEKTPTEGGTLYKKGQHEKIKGAVDLRKTEKGWERVM
ncbi:MAG TPA: hypothetical protein VG711_01110 [Phycisphaerales bacterium]|nr:hypothetical protein [Phycisphaerales bacterium]